ncbi:MAG TPA: NADP-dependent malic enzyme, partial [Flavobacteriaceae bacterium]|nr:NADP-dependent malic enzyme [Flavobacteriaceae bacterium]
FELIGKEDNISRVAACNIMLTKKGPIFLADTTINIDPTAEQLIHITKMTSNLAKLFGFKPNIAMLSFSNFGSSNTKETVKITQAVKYIHKNHPNTVVDGPIQADFVFNAELMKEKFPFSKLNGKKTNVLIFPNLDSANISYKMMKELYGAESIGPIMLGFKKPVHILQLGASVDEMVNMAAIAIIDAQEKERMNNKKK